MQWPVKLRGGCQAAEVKKLATGGKKAGRKGVYLVVNHVTNQTPTGHT